MTTLSKNRVFSANEVIWQSLHLYKASLGKAMPFVALLIVIDLIAQYYPLTGALVLNICTFFVELILACIIHETVLAERLPYDYIFNHVFGCFPSALFALALFLGAMLLGIFMLFVPGIFLFICLRFYYCHILFEGVHAIEALKRSYRLVKNNWWHTFFIVVMATLLLLGIKLLSSSLIYHFAPLPPPRGSDLIELISTSQTILASQPFFSKLFTASIDALVSPLAITFTVMQYHDLRNRQNKDRRLTTICL